MMNAIELKSDLYRLIEGANDLSLLKRVKDILSQKQSVSKDWADTLSDSLKEELELSIEEADNGETLSNSEAMERISQRYGL